MKAAVENDYFLDALSNIELRRFRPFVGVRHGDIGPSQLIGPRLHGTHRRALRASFMKISLESPLLQSNGLVV